MGIIKSTNNNIKAQFEIGNTKYPRIYPFNNPTARKKAIKYCLNVQDLIKLHEIFEKMDKKAKGYLKKNNFHEFLSTKYNSMEALYSDFFFDLIKKNLKNKLDYFEWLTGVLDFGLANEEFLLRFVFRMIDKENKEILYQKDIYLFLTIKRSNEYLFPLNNVKLVDHLIFKNEKFNFQEFKENQDKFVFLTYPVFELQNKIKKNILGREFWKRIQRKLMEKEAEDNKKSNQKIINENILKNKLEKIENNKKKIKLLNEKYLLEKLKEDEKKNMSFFNKKNIFGRKKGKRLSEKKLNYPNSKDCDFIITNQRKTKTPEKIINWKT